MHPLQSKCTCEFFNHPPGWNLLLWCSELIGVTNNRETYLKPHHASRAGSVDKTLQTDRQMQKAPIFRNSNAEVRHFRDTFDHALALYVDHHHHKILFLLLSCWTSFSWLVLIRRCCCCSCYGRFRCVVRRCCWRSCCLRGSYLLQCWHHPAQFKLPLPSLALSMWYVCDLLEIFDKLNTWSTFTFKFWSK